MTRFSIRDLLMAMAAVAVALGWWHDRGNWATLGADREIQIVQGHAYAPDMAVLPLWQTPFSQQQQGSLAPNNPQQGLFEFLYSHEANKPFADEEFSMPEFPDPQTYLRVPGEE